VIKIANRCLLHKSKLEKFKEWDVRGEKYEILKQQEIYVHTDSQWGFLIMSLNKEKLLEVAGKRKQDKIEDYEAKLKELKQLNFGD
jgi:hypothetical protein